MTERRLFLYASSGKAVEQGITRCKTQDSRKENRIHTRNDTDSSDAEERRRETKQSAARPGRAPQTARPLRSTGFAEHDST